MKRFAWLLLLVSLGLNLGLGWRLLRQSDDGTAAWSCQGWDEDRAGQEPSDRGERMDRPRGRSSGQHRRDFFRPAPQDSGAWCEIMEERLDRITRRLELDPDQVESFRATQRQNSERFRKQRWLVERAESRLFQLAAADSVRPDSVRLAVRDLGRRKALLDSLVTEAMLTELESLSPRQRELYLRILPWDRSGGKGAPSSGPGRHRDAEPPSPRSGE